MVLFYWSWYCILYSVFWPCLGEAHFQLISYLRGTAASLWSFLNSFFSIFSSCKLLFFSRAQRSLSSSGSLGFKGQRFTPWLSWTGSEEIELTQIGSDLNLILTGWQFMFVPPTLLSPEFSIYLKTTSWGLCY